MSELKCKRKTNIIYIVLDDMGFSDLGCYGSEVQTPHIDQIAAEGLRYNNFSVCPASSPTRASLLTGRDNNAVGMGNIANFVFDDDYPDITGRIKPEAGTVAEILHENGFATLAVGKWHVAPLQHETPAGPFDYWPLGKGFDRFYGWLEGETDQYQPQIIYDNHYVKGKKPIGYHASTDLVDHSIEFISDQVSIYPEKPFFMYLCFGVAHSPHQVPKEYIDRYKGLYAKGWNAVREERFRRQIAMGIVPEGSRSSDWDETIAHWDSLDAERRRLYEKFQETYAGFITHCDEEIGRLTAFLRQIGEYDNSLVCIISDNGASRDGGTEGVDDFYRTLNGSSPSFEEMFALIDDIGGPEVRALYPKGWAAVSNTPFPEYKGCIFGGGVREPLIVRWPDGIEDKGVIRSQLAHVTDITPTVLDILGIMPPETIRGVRQMPLHGRSLYQTFLSGEAPDPVGLSFFKWANTRGIVVGDWKAVSVHEGGKPFEEDQWTLFHLSEDFCESRDLAAEFPDKLEELKALWHRESGKYISLPMKEITPAQMQYIPPESPANRKHFRYVGPISHIGCSADPPTENTSHRITASFRRDSLDDDGVIAAQGGVCGGYTLYIRDNRLHYELNNFRTFYTLVSDEELPLGEVECVFEYQNTEKAVETVDIKDGPMSQLYGSLASDCAGYGKLFINGKQVAGAPMRSVRMGLSLESLDIGRDTMTPVSPNYGSEPEFPFRGALHEVCFDIL